MRDRLLKATKPVIEAACRRFVVNGDAVGAGVKLRMIGLFADLAEDSMRMAAGVASDLLRERFAELRGDISNVFKAWGDPLTRTVEAIAPDDWTGDQEARNQLMQRLASLRFHARTGLPTRT